MAHSLSVQDLTTHVSVDFGGAKVGTGGYGDIYKGQLKLEVNGHTGAVAVKMTRYNFKNAPAKVLKSFRKELEIWGQQDHPHVLSLLGFYTHGDVKCPVSPWCESGTISNYFTDAREGRKPELQAPITDCEFDKLRLHCLELELLAQVADGLAYLHRNNIVHGDIKSSNILVNNGVACLTDFGLSVLAEHSQSGTSSNLDGSIRWTAPEYFERRAHHTREGDMWAFGCVILEVRTLNYPYHGLHIQGVLLAIPKVDPYPLPEVINPSLWDIAKGCWIRTPIPERKTSQDVLHALTQLAKHLRTVREAFAPASWGMPDPSTANPSPQGRISARSSEADSLAKLQDITTAVVVDFGRKVASGGYGDVYKGELTREVNGYSGVVAVKVTRLASSNVSDKVVKRIKEEIELWQQHMHPSILPLIGIYVYEGMPPCTVSPWCDRGTILEYIMSARGGHEPELDAPVTDCDFDLLRLHCLELKLLTEVAAGLAYLHEHDLAHGNIKASNILVKGGVAQLCDFGYSVLMAEHLGDTSSHLGTFRWFAPELYEEGAHRTQEADMWAFGCAILEVRTLLLPYHRLSELEVPLSIRKYRPFERPKDIHPSLWSMAEACWSQSPAARIVSATLVNRMKTTLKYATLLRKALGALPNVRSLSLGYPDSTSTARFSLASLISKGDDLTLTVATAGNALRALEAPGKRYRPAALRPTIRLISLVDARLAESLMFNLPGPTSLGTPIRGHTSTVTSAVFLSEGRRLVSSSHDGTLRIWDIETGETVIGPLKGHTGHVRGLAVHGSRIASCSDEGRFRVWDADSGKVVLEGSTVHHSRGMNCIAYSKDGTRIATGNDYHVAVSLWDAHTGVLLREMVGHRRSVLCVAFSEDGTRIVSGSNDNTVRIWDAASGVCIGEPLAGHTDSVRSVCFSLDDTRIFSSSDDSTIRVWDVTAHTRALFPSEPLRMDNWVVCLALSPDGKRLVSGSSSGRMAMWDANTGAEIPTPFKDHEGQVLSLAFSPDGHMIASASDDKTIALWDSTDEWKQYEINDEDKQMDDD